MSDRDQQEFLDLIDEKMGRIKRKAAQGGLLDFVKAVYPNYMVGAHHKRLAKLLEDAIDGDKKRIIVNIAPRMGKSELVSYLFPAWFLGHHPDKKIIMATHTADLSTTFGRRVRDLGVLFVSYIRSQRVRVTAPRNSAGKAFVGLRSSPRRCVCGLSCEAPWA